MSWTGCAFRPASDTTEHIPPAPGLHDVRVGVEFVASNEPTGASDSPHEGREPPRAQLRPAPTEREAGVVGPVAPRPLGPSLRPLTKRQIAALPTAAERATFRFFHTLVGRDGERLPQEFGWSYLQRQLGAADQWADDPWAQSYDEDVEEALQEIGPDLLRKPFRNALRELPLVRDVEISIEDFKRNNVPTSGAWLDSHDEDRRQYGHLGLRFQADGTDPLAVTYSLHGWRLGASRDRLRAGFSAPLGDGLWLAVGSTFDHALDRFDAMAELKFDVSARTRLILTFGNEINVFPGAALERAAHKDLDGAAGAMVYVESVF